MTTEQFAVVLFFTSNHAFRAEKVLKDLGVACKLVPVPRHLSSECGVCIRIGLTQLDSIEKIMQTAHVEIDRVHKLDSV